jgi:hypothetical protein
MMAGDVKPSYTASQAFSWASTDLATLRPGQKVVFFSHDLMLSDENGHSVLSFKSDTLDISKYDVEAYIYGHRHTQITQEFPDNIIAYGTGCAHKGAIDHTPSLYRVFTILPDGTLNTYDHFTTVNRQLQANVFIKDGVYSHSCEHLAFIPLLLHKSPLKTGRENLHPLTGLLHGDGTERQKIRVPYVLTVPMEAFLCNTWLTGCST